VPAVQLRIQFYSARPDEWAHCQLDGPCWVVERKGNGGQRELAASLPPILSLGLRGLREIFCAVRGFDCGRHRTAKMIFGPLRADKREGREANHKRIGRSKAKGIEGRLKGWGVMRWRSYYVRNAPWRCAGTRRNQAKSSAVSAWSDTRIGARSTRHLRGRCKTGTLWRKGGPGRKRRHV